MDAGLTTDKRKKIAVLPRAPVKEVMGGHDNKGDFLPAVHDDESLGLTYCGGFLDNRGAEINIANACNIKQTIAQARSVRVMVLINYHSPSRARTCARRLIPSALPSFSTRRRCSAVTWPRRPARARCSSA